ncbi:MAG: phosphoribosylformylglycinamidine cyclo-ligase [Actinomycetota bacterium]
MTSYREAGVDLEAAARAVSLIRNLAAGATRPEVEDSVGGFAGLFRIGEGRSLAAATDGVGTKTEIARLAGRFDTVGIDLVAMCADDVVCTGAEPLFLLDYIAAGKVVPSEIAGIVAGVAEGCRRAGCALLGGETAEHPGTMEPGQFDLAGFCVGIVDEEAMLGPNRVEEGDVLLGLPSSGLHSNGFSLVRRWLDEKGFFLRDRPEEIGRRLEDELLEPTAIYAPTVLELARDGLVAAAAHITGGGLIENVPRVLPEGLGAEIDRSTWEVQPIFELIQRDLAVSVEEMFLTFNMGIGMVLVVSPDQEQVTLDAAGDGARVIGRVVAGTGVDIR